MAESLFLTMPGDRNMQVHPVRSPAFSTADIGGLGRVVGV